MTIHPSKIFWKCWIIYVIEDIITVHNLLKCVFCVVRIVPKSLSLMNSHGDILGLNSLFFDGDEEYFGCLNFYNFNKVINNTSIICSILVFLINMVIQSKCLPQ